MQHPDSWMFLDEARAEAFALARAVLFAGYLLAAWARTLLRAPAHTAFLRRMFGGFARYSANMAGHRVAGFRGGGSHGGFTSQSRGCRRTVGNTL